jgi:phage terminase large subunit
VPDVPPDGVIRINYTPRTWFQPFHDRKQRFACLVCHRRAGKTVACVHELQRAALRSSLERSRFAYIGPTYSQTKAVAWDYLLDAAAPIMPFGAKANSSELRVDYPNGSQVRLFGADNYEALRGLRFDGVVLDEYANFDPRAWPEVISPTLADRRGFAVFIGTPKGHNQFYYIWSDAQERPDWFTLMLKASDTVPLNAKLTEDEAASRGLLTPLELERARSSMSEEQYSQEYEVSFEAAIVGAFYGRQMAEAERSGRICNVPYDPNRRVYTAWDIGGDNDTTVIWFAQLTPTQVNIIDYYQAVNADSAPHAKTVLQKPYIYAGHFLPHDAAPRRTGIDKNYTDFLEAHGMKDCTVLPRGNVEPGINAARLLLPRCYFDRAKCANGIEALKMYRSEYDEKKKILSSHPVHDWASHPADAFRYLAVGLDGHVRKSNFSRKIVYPKYGIA